MRAGRWLGTVRQSMKKKVDRPARTIETFADGSSLETCPDGSVLLREGRLARALPVRDEAGSLPATAARQVRYDETPPARPAGPDKLRDC